MTIALNNRSFVGMATLTVERLRDGLVYNFPVPQNFVLIPNIQQKIQLTRDATGREARARTYVTGEQPELTITYQHMRPELISFAVGNELISGSYSTHLPKVLQVLQNNYAAAATGYLGKGVVADAVSSASYIDATTNASVALTQQPFASIDVATDTLSFAVGLDGALIFSDDVVALKPVVAISIPYTFTANAWGDLLQGDHRITATMVDTENTISIFQAPLCTVNLQGSQINTASDAFELKFYVNTPPGACRSYNLYETTLKVACNG